MIVSSGAAFTAVPLLRAHHSSTGSLIKFGRLFSSRLVSSAAAAAAELEFQRHHDSFAMIRN